jgi:glutamate---cysteine ligase / carboxylate-amine ligase
VGIEEEVMLLAPRRGALSQSIGEVLAALPDQLHGKVTSETHSAAVELTTGVHSHVDGAVAELSELRRDIASVLHGLQLAAAVAGTHPFAVWDEMVVAPGARHQGVLGSVRALARREPTFALHVHVGLPDPEVAMRVANRMRVHLPLLLALSANSPYWQGRDTGLASARTPLFQAFPRVGIPRQFPSFRDWADSIDLLIRTDTLPDPTYIWWDVRPQPRFGTVEIRIMDAQTSLDRVGPLVALVQSLARLEATEGYAADVAVNAQEVLEENRFLATRDGVEARFVDPVYERRVSLRVQLREILEACAPHAAALGCSSELAGLEAMADDGADARQRHLADTRGGLEGLVEALAAEFLSAPAQTTDRWERGRAPISSPRWPQPIAPPPPPTTR